jgi:hypothetical protein
MSCRRPKLTYRRRVVQRSALRSTDDGGDSLSFLSVADAPRPKRPRNSKDLFLPGHEELITLPGGVSLTQPLVIANSDSVPTRYAAAKDSDSEGAKRKCPTSPPLTAVTSPTAVECNERRNPGRELEKARRVSSKWMTDVLPSLLPVYLRLLRETRSLRLSPNDLSFSCTCDSTRSLKVTCIFFQRKY